MSLSACMSINPISPTLLMNQLLPVYIIMSHAGGCVCVYVCMCGIGEGTHVAPGV